MASLPLTIFYSSILALVFAGLTLPVVFQRRRNNVPYGDGDIPGLRSAIRAHGNFAEYVPLSIILLGLMELSGFDSLVIHTLFLALIMARTAHAVAMFSPPGSRRYYVTRIVGAFTTWLILAGSGISLLIISLL